MLKGKKKKKNNKSSEYNAIAVHWNHADADMICPLLKEPLDITGGLDIVVAEGLWYFLTIKYLAHFRLFF